MTDPESCPPDPGTAEPLRPVPDLGGMPAADARGVYFGEVYGTLADTDSGLIRYLDLDVHGTGRHVLVPVGHAHVQRHGEAPEIRLRAATRADLAGIPASEPHTIPDDDFQDLLLAAHCRLFSGERYYAHPAFDHAGLYAGEHPIVAPALAVPEGPLARLSDLSGYAVAEGESDVRGWPLVGSGGERTGVVEELIVDPVARKVRYAEVRLEGGRAVLVPVGLLSVEPESRRVRAAGLTAADLRALPAAPDRAPTREQEEALRAALDARLDGARRFERPDFRGLPRSHE